TGLQGGRPRLAGHDDRRCARPCTMARANSAPAIGPGPRRQLPCLHEPPAPPALLMERLLDLVHVFAIEEIWRLGLTASVFALVPLSLKFSRVHLARTWAGATMTQRRERQVV